MTDFPSLEGLEKSSDGTEYIYGGSVAINRFLNHLREEAFLPKTQRQNVYTQFFFNMFTLVDNIFDPKATSKVNDVSLATEIEQLLIYISAYSDYVLDPTQKMQVVFYWSDYQKIPSDLRLQPKEKTQKALRDSYYATHYKNSVAETYMYNEKVEVIVCRVGGKSMYPYEQLRPYVKRSSGLTDEISLLMSHSYVDYYLLQHASNVRLVQRYFHRILTREELKDKLLKGDLQISFTPYTHALFGDGVQIKPMISGRFRTQVLDLVQREQWVKFSDSIIESRLKRLGFQQKKRTI